jgi:hypothetical protein
VNLLTKIKSPTSNVGTIELEGIRKGSNKNDRTTNTKNSTGKNERAYSTIRLSLGIVAFESLERRQTISPRQIIPHTAVMITNSSEKSIRYISPELTARQFLLF